MINFRDIGVLGAGVDPNTLTNLQDPTGTNGAVLISESGETWVWNEVTDLWVMMTSGSGADKFHSNIVATAPYDDLNPLTGWVAPTNPIEGNTVDVKFTDGTVANYTYDGTVWGLDFVVENKAINNLQVVNEIVERGNVSLGGSQPADFTRNTYNWLGGSFQDKWQSTGDANLFDIKANQTINSANTTNSGAGAINIGTSGANGQYKLNLHGALWLNNGRSSQIIGDLAAINNTGSQVVAIGTQAARLSTNSDIIAIGFEALKSNNKDQSIGIGISAGQNNTGQDFTAVGYLCGYANSGNKFTGLGYQSGQNNSGLSVLAIGNSASFNNIGSYITSVGEESAQNNTGSSVLAIGRRSARTNSGNSVTSIGIEAGNLNTGSGL